MVLNATTLIAFQNEVTQSIKKPLSRSGFFLALSSVLTDATHHMAKAAIDINDFSRNA